MKINSKQYAQALYESVKDKDKKEIETAIQNFVRILGISGKISQADKIVKEFLALWNREAGIVEAEVQGAKVFDKSILDSLNGFIKNISNAQTVDIKTKEDRTLLGGVIIKYQDKIFDGSLRTKLSALKEEMGK